MKKKIIRISVIFLVGLFSCSAYGQFGVKGGIGVASISVKTQGVKNNLFQGVFSFHVGGTYQIEVSDIISIESGVLLTQKGFKIVANNQSLKSKLLFIEVPVTAKGYVFDIGDEARLYGLAGGYMGFMLSNKINGVKFPIGNTPNNLLKGFDAGLTFGGGIELFESLAISLSADIGLANLSNDVNETSRLNVFKLSVGYMF